MLDYLFQHFYSTLAILAFLLAIVILRACGKRGRSWIPVSTAPFGCVAFLAIFLLLTAFITWIFGFFTAGPTLEDIAFTLGWLLAVAAALAVISRLTAYYLRQDKAANKLYPGESRKLLPGQLRNKGILLFVLIGAISCAIDIITVPFPVPELPPGSALSASTRIPLPPEVPLDVRISSRVTNRFFGECDFDLTVREKNGRKHIFPAVLINPGGGSAITIYRLRAQDNRHHGSLVFTNEMESCLLNLDTMQMKSLSGPASNYPLPTREDLHGPDMELRLETVGLYRGLSCIRGAEHTETTRANVLKNLKEIQP
ncbi:hypothetical protein CXU22_07380 [Akkermansia muciniphila]|uniref:Uncharacterized protein n=1 Tax=Akkermansia muciniphila TaxID=239935 RepID=A0A2N8HCE7_9BACT|nr:hypothetical protein [Akkermansia muciniphila]PNC17569.1 hypothetical protein CXU22_07380 [Akkermansia muciniphila]